MLINSVQISTCFIFINKVCFSSSLLFKFKFKCFIWKRMHSYSMLCQLFIYFNSEIFYEI